MQLKLVLSTSVRFGFVAVVVVVVCGAYTSASDCAHSKQVSAAYNLSAGGRVSKEDKTEKRSSES